MSVEKNLHIVVKGMVQGVGFRYFVYKNAVQLGLHGYARNLADGNVEIELNGDRSLIEEMIKIVRVGPRSANVTDVQIEWIEETRNYKSFEIF
ncbi:MAG: acylphosphatase [Ignavibacteriales bacterium]|nr:acylphosphatase [Ignavibacteriales bacterium]